MSGKVIPVRVAVRCRPLISKEESEGCQCCISFVNEQPQLVVGTDKSFTFDYVFKPDVDQSIVYESAVQPLVQGLFKGYNATVLAYGQTGSGKTYSMGGGYEVSLNSKAETMGIIPRVIKELFDGMKDLDAKYSFAIKVSYLELYKEDLMDLFVSTDKRNRDTVVIRDDMSGGIKLTGMTEIVVSTYEETMKRLEKGSQGRTTGATAMNNQSSRSHAIFTIHLERTCRNDSNDFCKAKFHLVDLAGSERIKKTHAEGERLKEGININKGLLALGNVISALGDDNNKKNHIPYRDSKLTRLLQDSLGGNSHTLMVACISPADSNCEETVSTLRYADRARKIKNKPIVNQDPQAAELMRLRKLVQELQQGKVQGSGSNRSSMSSSGEDCAKLKERIVNLEAEKRELISELDCAIQRSTHMMERLISAETAKERLDVQLNEVHKKLQEATKVMQEANTSNNTGNNTDSPMSRTLALVKLAQDQICQINSESLDQANHDIEDDNNGSTNTPDDQENGAVENGGEINGGENGEGGNDGENGGNDGGANEELRNNHVIRQAQLTRELQDLNNVLMKKQDLASKMLCNEQQMLEMKEHYESQNRDMEAEVGRLQREKDEVCQTLHSIKANKINQKLAEQRRKKVQELEGKINDLKKKMLEQARMIKMKETSEKQVNKLNSEIVNMKQQRVRLMKQIKEDSDIFRKLKADMTKQVLQLKSQGRKRQAEMAKMERAHSNQQAVLKRKAEEASAANNRLKEVLMRQKRVLEDKHKKQDIADMTGAGARARKLVKDELEFLLTVEEARLQLKEQLGARKEMKERCGGLKGKLDQIEKGNDSMTDDNKTLLLEALKQTEQQIDICNAQISELQQKLLDVDQDEKIKSRWENIHTMLEAKCALKWLVNAAVAAKVDVGRLDGKVYEMKMQNEEVLKLVEKSEEDINKISQNHDIELDDIRKHYETKVLFLLGQARRDGSAKGVSESERVEELKKVNEIQATQLEKLGESKDSLEQKYEGLIQNVEGMSRVRIKSKEAEKKISSGTSKRSKSRRLTRFEEIEVTSEEDDVKKDPSWSMGLTPQASKQSPALMPVLDDDEMNKTFVRTGSSTSISAADENMAKRPSKARAVQKKRSSPVNDATKGSPDSAESTLSQPVHEDDTLAKKPKLQPLKNSFFANV